MFSRPPRPFLSCGGVYTNHSTTLPSLFLEIPEPQKAQREKVPVSSTIVDLECLRRILEDILRKKGRMPKKLYLQMDHTCKDNKNWIFFTYLGYLFISLQLMYH